MSNRTEKIVLEIKLPVGVQELAAIGDALAKIHGDDLLIRQSGPLLQIFKNIQTT